MASKKKHKSPTLEERIAETFGGKEHIPPGFLETFMVLSKDAKPLQGHRKNLNEELRNEAAILYQAIRDSDPSVPVSPPDIRLKIRGKSYAIPTPAMVEDFVVEFAQGMNYVFTHCHDENQKPFHPPRGFYLDPNQRKGWGGYCGVNLAHDNDRKNPQDPLFGKLIVAPNPGIINYLVLTTADCPSAEGYTARERAFLLGVEEAYHVVQDLDNRIHPELQRQTTAMIKQGKNPFGCDHEGSPYEVAARLVERQALEVWTRSQTCDNQIRSR